MMLILFVAGFCYHIRICSELQYINKLVDIKKDMTTEYNKEYIKRHNYYNEIEVRMKEVETKADLFEFIFEVKKDVSVDFENDLDSSEGKIEENITSDPNVAFKNSS